jgi:hypothetical protein
VIKNLINKNAVKYMIFDILILGQDNLILKIVEGFGPEL